MHIISCKKLRGFWEKHPDSRQPLQAWHKAVKRANWTTPSDIKAFDRSASILPNNRVVFNIKGNNYRLIVVIRYEYHKVYIAFIGTHQDYDKIDATTVWDI